MKLDVNYYSILGFSLPHLPYFQSAMKVAFPELEISYRKLEDQDQTDADFEFRQAGDGPVLFDICQATSWNEQAGTYNYDGYSAFIRVQHADVSLLGKYHLEETRLKDFVDPNCYEVNFDPRETSVVCYGKVKGGYSGSFYFSPPEGYSGNIKAMNAEQFRECVLSFATFSFAPKSSRPEPFISEVEGLGLMTEMAAERETNAARPSESDAAQQGAILNPVDEIVRKSFDYRKAIGAYARLANLAVHTSAKTKAKQALKNAFENLEVDHPSAEELFNALVDATPNDTPTDWPIFSVDWKATITGDIDFAVQSQLAKVAKGLTLPDTSVIPKEAGITEAEHLRCYASQLEDIGYDLYFGGLNSDDSHKLIIAPLVNRKKMALFIKDSACSMCRA